MESKFTPSLFEQTLYDLWERNILNKSPKGKPFTILMPPPNANASLHAGHGMYVIDDIMIRWKLLNGFDAQWIPGMDHAGFETQYVYEKYLAKQGKSRLDFDRKTLLNNIFQFVKDNSGLIYKQFKRLGFLAKWNKSVFMLDAHVLKRVFDTFYKMEREGYVYRSDYIVNYCTHCGTSLSELEVEHIERIDPLYYIKYGPFTLATVRPETKFGDTALAVYPQDKRYAKWVGKEVEAVGLLGKFKIKVIADEYVDPEFGTGVVKITPAHDPNDFEVGKRHHLPVKSVIDFTGRLNEHTGIYKGLKVKAARQRVAEDLQKKGLIEKIDTQYLHSVTVCYKCKRDLEPMVVPNWFIRVDKLKKPVIEAVKENKVKFYPVRYKRQLLQWLEVMHDWPISRQIVWGIRIPVWYSITDNPEMFVVFIDKNKQQVQGKIKEILNTYSLQEITDGLQKLTVPTQAKYIVSQNVPGEDYIQETDTFDTWFSSSQWPLVTLKENEFESRYPTDFLGTLSDILPFWVSRMILFSLYIKKQTPFKTVFLWSMVADSKGQKMSKSKGNVINPIELVDKYGADAFRASLLFGTTAGAKVNLSEDKVRAMRNFANKIWNMGRFITINSKSQITNTKQIPNSKYQNNNIKKIVGEMEKELEQLQKSFKNSMKKYYFSKALGDLYEFIWHRLADYYIEQLKEELKHDNIEVLTSLKETYLQSLKMLHPFMPFVTDAIWQQFYGKDTSLLEVKFI